MLPVVLIGMGSVGLMGYYNQRTTGNPLLMPYVLNERTYSSLPLFLGQQSRYRARRETLFSPNTMQPKPKNMALHKRIRFPGSSVGKWGT